MFQDSWSSVPGFPVKCSRILGQVLQDFAREQGETFVAMRRQHPAVESAINNLEHRGLDRVRSKGREGFARTVALAVVALNVHRLGRVLRQQALERHRLAA